MSRIRIIIVAAGSGLRYGDPLPKQFCLLAGKPVVMHTVDAFRRILPEASITLVISRDMAAYWQNLCTGLSFESPKIVFGGSSRWESVRNAIIAADDNADLIMVHDAARPIIDPAMINRITEVFDISPDIDGVIPVVAVTDSIRSVRPGVRYSRSVDRNALRAVQTPQAFRAEKLAKAYKMPFRESFTDDASVMEAAGFSHINLVEGSTRNIKITNPGDIDIAALYLKAASHR